MERGDPSLLTVSEQGTQAFTVYRLRVKVGGWLASPVDHRISTTDGS